MNTTSKDGNQQPSVFRGDPGADRTPTDGTRDPQSAASSADPLPSEIDPPFSDDVLLGVWRSVQGPQAGLTGPLIRYAGLVARAVSRPTGEALVRAVVALLDTLPADYDWNADPHFLTLLEGAMSRLQSPTAKFKAAADPALRTLSQQWRDRAVATDAFAMEPQHSEQARSNLQHLAAQMELCAADLDRLCPEIREAQK